MSKKLIRGFRTNIMLYGMCLAAFVIAAFPFSPLLAVAEALVSALVLYVGVRRNRMAQHSVRQYLDRVSGGMDTARSSNMLYAPLPMLVFDLNTGETVKIMDLAEDGESLRAAVKENLLYQIQKSNLWTEYGADSFFEDYEDTVGNWADQCLVFGDSGLTVVFNPYTIAPYAVGELSYLIPYSLLGPYLNGRAVQLLGLS